jgi:ubiquinone/menaquinone biosynthesis C-methylase UbiE
MNDKVFNGAVEKLRSPERREKLQIERVINYSLAGIEAARALDIGTGTGLFAEAFANRGLKVKAVDCNSEFLELARSLVPQVEFKEAAAEKLPFDKASFDLVFMGHVLHEADDPLKAMKEAHRVLKKRFIILEWPYRLEESGPPLDHRMTAEQIQRLATQAGFAICDLIQLRFMHLYILEK